MNNPVIMHITYGEPTLTIEESCTLAKKIGFDGIEFRRRKDTEEESMLTYLDRILKAKEETGLEYILFGAPGPNLMDENSSVREEELEWCDKFYREAAKRFNLTVCNTMTGPLVAEGNDYMTFEKNGSAIATEDQWRWATEGFQLLGDLAEELGFKFAFETHNCYIHDLVEPSCKLVDDINRKSVGINIDYGNILLNKNGGSLEDSIKAFGKRIYYAHLKNCFMISGLEYHNYISCSLSQGAIDNRTFLKLLKEEGYKGPIAIEGPRPGDRIHYVKEDFAYLKEMMAEI
ncbi:MAG: sugar phosphate isomerase/epimerase family protein [Planctomycetota bacterium]|jgi:sugar phosphate isomerase/epimerase